MYSLTKSVLFKCEAETSHHLAMAALAVASRSKVLAAMTARLMGAGRSQQRDCPTEVMGIRFPNPVGLAAGLDKDAVACNALHALGFGWLELGTVTPEPQPGNARPRIFRLPEHAAMINRLGFNSLGLERFVDNLKKSDPAIIKGINIGKNAATPISHAVDDYVRGLRQVHAYADYVAINISSPNTQDLRQLQRDQALDALLHSLNRERRQLSDSSGRRIPLVLKISPDITASEVAAIAALSRRHQMDGICATNSTVSREQLGSHAVAGEAGGLSGPPLQARSTAIVAALHANLQGEIPIIGVGGIDDAASAQEKFDAGASLIQLYTGLIYRGPKLIREILQQCEF